MSNMTNELIATEEEVRAFQQARKQEQWHDDLQERRIEWANALYHASGRSTLWPDVFSEGHQRALKQVAKLKAGTIHIEHHGQGWQPSVWVCFDLLTYAMAFPQQRQVLTSFSGACSFDAIIAKYTRIIEDAQNSLELVERFPMIDQWDVNEYGVSGHSGQYMIQWGEVNRFLQEYRDPQWHTPVDRLFVLNFEQARTDTLGKLLQWADAQCRTVLLGYNGLPDPEARIERRN